jgi:hypothetical protein
MTLDEAIEHCEEKAKCGDSCGREHKQLAEWLRELKVFRKIFKENVKEKPKHKRVHGVEDGEPEEW